MGDLLEVKGYKKRALADSFKAYYSFLLSEIEIPTS